MDFIVGTYAPDHGHTFVAEGFGKIYALRSLPASSSLCVFDGHTLAPLGEYPTPGEHSCHITLLAHQAVLADYTSGTLSVFDLTAEGLPVGTPTVIPFEGHGLHPIRQQGPHIHSSVLSLDGSTLLVIDLGCDKIYRFAVKEGRLAPACVGTMHLPDGSGPRCALFGTDKNLLYVVTELSDEVLVCRWDGQDELTVLQRHCFNPSHPGGGGQIALSPDGRFLYASSRVMGTAGEGRCSYPDGVAVFQVENDGMLSPLTYQITGGHPRHFSLSADGTLLLVACRDSDVIQVFSRDASTGELHLYPKTYTVPKPVYVAERKEHKGQPASSFQFNCVFAETVE